MEFSLWLGAIKIIIIIKIMHRFKWWSCMLLTQYSKHLILMSQYSVPNLISDLQSDKNKGKKARDIRWRHQSFFFKLETEVCLHLARVTVRWGKKLQNRYSFSTPETQPLTADLQSLYDSTLNSTHTYRSPSKTPFYLPISITTVI